MNNRMLPRWAAIAIFLAAGAGRAEVTGENWPGFRGDGSGLSADRDLPLHWSGTDNVLWKTEVPGEGWSSPIVWGDRLFLSAGTDGGKSRLVLCYSADTGKLLWQKPFDLKEPPKLYPATGLAPSTPVTDGQRVYIFFEGLGLVALDLDGNLLWTTPLGPFNNMHSEGTSPALYKDSVILCCDQEKDGFVAAFDAATGALRWSTPRNLGSHWSTPLLIEYQGKPQVVVGARTVISYDPETGKELWSCKGLSPNVAPSPVYADNLVWASSGRNGPSMIIDPGGQGEVSETAVRMYYPTGGPYVPSPVVCPLLMLPGDDGQVRFLNRRGEVAVELRVKGHFYASPVVAAQRVYWTSQDGETYVLDVSRLTASPPEAKVLAVNPLGEKCNASPAVSRGRLYLRGVKHLFCIAGGTAKAAPQSPAAPPPTFAELEKIFKEHPAADGPDVAVRIQVVEGMAALRDAQIVPFLMEATLKDPHYDVPEAAAKVLGKQGEAATPGLRSLLADGRPFVRIIAAQGLGQRAEAAAVPELVKMMQAGDALSRLAAQRALGEIMRAHAETVADVLPPLLVGLRDPEAVVRAGAAEALGRAQVPTGESRTRVVRALLDALADRSPLVTAAAERVLIESYQLPKEALMEDVVLYGAQRPAPVVAQLRAGPVRLKFQDGELRYLYVGDREIVRRVYFGVRDSRWDTVMPEFDKIEVEHSADGFRIQLAAHCRNDVADYAWTGEIVGTPEGKITFHLSGAASTDFSTPRVGVNVLFGSDALAGVAYETTDANGKTVAGTFPKLISPALLTDMWTRLSYRIGDLGVVCQVTGAEFGMEDQRNFGDSSYKAYSGLAYKYPKLVKGERQEETVELIVTGGTASAAVLDATSISIGPALPGAVLAKVMPPPADAVSFLQINQKPADYRNAVALSMSFNPALHMPDEDTYMENLTALAAQVVSVRVLAPKARLAAGPLVFDSPYPRATPDPRHQGRFAAAWAAAALLELTGAGVPEVSFKLGPAVQPVLAVFSQQAGSPLLETKSLGTLPLAVRAQAALVQGQRVLWLVNQTPDRQIALVEGLKGQAKVNLQRFIGENPPAAPVEATAAVTQEVLRLELAPYEVVAVNLGKQP